MLIATVFALTAAILHAGWNLIAKRSIDPFLALWGQFVVAGLSSGIVLLLIGGPPLGAWGWASLTGAIHVPYVLGLANAYRHGDFSLAYPVARGGGALLAAIGGIVLLDDELHPLSVVAIVIIVLGMVLLAYGAAASQIAPALLVAVSIGSYTVVDSHAARQTTGLAYVFAVFVMLGVATTIVGIAGGHAPALLRVGGDAWRRTCLAAAMSVVTYGLVLLAVRRAPVGYVAALRESSVLIASVVGWRLLGEQRGPVRSVATGVILTGLVVLVSAR